jgi:hypothetical protein
MASVRGPAPVLVALVGVALLGLSSHSAHAARHAAREGDIAPAFELPNTMKELVRLDDYAGAPLVLVFYRGFF